MIIGIVNEKGGAGKTTTAVNYFGCLMNSGVKAILIDTDVGGKACNIIARCGEGELSTYVYSCPGGDFDALTETLKYAVDEDTQLVIIDTPAGIGVELINVADVSDKLVIPGKTSVQDRELTLKTANTIKRMSETPIYFQPTGIKSGQIMSDIALEAYHGMEGTLCLPSIREAADIEKAGNEGLTVFEYNNKSNVIDDYEKAIDALLHRGLANGR